jgi:hypothetical protein
LAFLLTAGGSVASTISQTETLTPTTAYGWTTVTVGSIALANGTNVIDDIFGAASVRDQGWGGHDYWGNDLRLGLFDGATQLWSVRMAGAGRAGLNPIAQIFDITVISGALDGLNTALSGVAWTPTSDVRIDAYTAGHGWSGWSITVDSGSFTVESSIAPVPLPAAASLLLAGLAGLGVAGRMRKRPA